MAEVAVRERRGTSSVGGCTDSVGASHLLSVVPYVLAMMNAKKKEKVNQPCR